MREANVVRGESYPLSFAELPKMTFGLYLVCFCIAPALHVLGLAVHVGKMLCHDLDSVVIILQRDICILELPLHTLDVRVELLIGLVCECRQVRGPLLLSRDSHFIVFGAHAGRLRGLGGQPLVLSRTSLHPATS